jgi:anti-sigma factor RsiW
MTTETHSIETIRAYLLGQLPENETEQLDELTITDEEYAERVRAVEHDLVDAFARGELEGLVLEQFRAHYLTTPRRLEATRFARALQSYEAPLTGSRSTQANRGPTAATSAEKTPRWRHWLPLAAAVVLAVASAWLALENRALRDRAMSAELQRDQQLRAAETPSATEPPAPSTGVAPSLPAVATLLLTPQLRSGRQLPTVTLTGGGNVAVQLDLEPVDYPAYDAALIASSGNRVVWQSGRLMARTRGERQRIDLSFPAGLLSPQDYLIRVSGLPERGAPEIVGEYGFSISR